MFLWLLASVVESMDVKEKNPPQQTHLSLQSNHVSPPLSHHLQTTRTLSANKITSQPTYSQPEHVLLLADWC